MIELIWAKELILQKVTIAKNVWFATTGFLIMDSNFKMMCGLVDDLTMLSVNIMDTFVTNVSYCFIFHNISKSESINLLQNSVCEDRGYI